MGTGDRVKHFGGTDQRHQPRPLVDRADAPREVTYLLSTSLMQRLFWRIQFVLGGATAVPRNLVGFGTCRARSAVFMRILMRKQRRAAGGGWGSAKPNPSIHHKAAPPAAVAQESNSQYTGGRRSWAVHSKVRNQRLRELRRRTNHTYQPSASLSQMGVRCPASHRSSS